MKFSFLLAIDYVRDWKYVLGVYVSAMAYLFGVTNIATMEVIRDMVALDLVLGVFSAVTGKRLSTRAAWVGCGKLACSFALLIFSNFFDRSHMSPVQLFPIASLYVYWTYGVSVIHHLVKLGLPVPPAILKAVEGIYAEPPGPDPSPEATPGAVV